MNLSDEWSADTVRANGVDLRSYRIGDGPPIVMAHGFYDGGRRWVPLAEDLAEDYDVVAYDARGHGRSDAPATGYDVENRVADLVGVVRGLELEKPVLFGHSMGGATAAWTAAERPDLPRALVLEDPTGMHETPDLAPDELAAIVRERLEGVDGKSVEEVVAEHYEERDPEQARRLATASLECSPRVAEIAREGYPSPLVDVFPRIACPTLVLRSDGDVERRVRDLDAADLLSDGRLVHVRDAGHYVLEDEYDDAYAEVRTFLRRA